MGLAILAGVVLIPECAEWSEEEYLRGLQAAKTADMEAQIRANDRAIEGVMTDPVLIQRIALNQGDHRPLNAVVVAEDRRSAPPPYAARPAPHPLPAPPNAWLVRSGARLRNPPTRRALCLLAMVLVFAAMLLFAAPRSGCESPRAASKGKS